MQLFNCQHVKFGSNEHTCRTACCRLGKEFDKTRRFSDAPPTYALVYMDDAVVYRKHVGDEILSTLARKDGAILYGNIFRLETDFVNCSYIYLLNVGPSLRMCEHAVSD